MFSGNPAYILLLLFYRISSIHAEFKGVKDLREIKLN